MTEEEIKQFEDMSDAFWTVFKSFYKNFSTEQSFELTKIVFTHVLTRSTQSDIFEQAKGLFQ